MQASATKAPDSALYRRVWRWHFYAGLVCLPFLALMAVTGGLYLYKDNLEALLYRSLLFVPPTGAAPATTLAPSVLLARAQAAVPGEPARYIAPPQPGRSAEVGLRTAAGPVSVYLDPADGRVLGHLRDPWKLSELLKRLHALTIAGPVGNHWVEIVAGWAIVLVVSGVFLWWPRGRSGGVLRVRGRPAQRQWWRDLHAVVGVFAAVAIVFLAVTGMPWSAFWGQQFGRLANAWGVGAPAYLWGKPSSTVPLAALGDVPWTLAQTPVPQSAHHDGHHADTGTGGTAPDTAPASTAGIGIDEAQRLFTGLGLPAGTPVSLPMGPRGVYTAMYFPDDTRAKRVVHLDRYTGAVLADVGDADFGIVGRVSDWGISIHTGRQFGWPNQLVMLAACIAIVLLAASATVMWWKRRPSGRLGAPARQGSDSAAGGAVAMAVLLGLFYPLLGASMLAALLVDCAVPRRRQQRLGL